MAFFNNFPSDGPSTVAFDTQAANHHPDLGPALWLARRRRALRRQDLGVIIPFPKRKVTRSVALENADIPIRCNCICPGPVDTPLLQELFAKDPERAARRIR